MAELAARHPQVHIILEQTYADLIDISSRVVQDEIKKILRYKPNEESKVKKAILAGLTQINTFN